MYSSSTEIFAADEMSLMTCEMLVNLAGSSVHACVHTTWSLTFLDYSNCHKSHYQHFPPKKSTDKL
jgi:hypothetical protein